MRSRPEPSRDLPERAVAAVLVERVRACVRDEEVRVPVVVEVARRHAEREVEVLPGEPAALGRVLEAAVAAAAQQAAPIRGVGPRHLGEPGAVREEHVERAVAVEIGECHSPAHRLREVLAVAEVVVRRVGEARARGRVPERDGRRLGPRVAGAVAKSPDGAADARDPHEAPRPLQGGHGAGSLTTSTWLDAIPWSVWVAPLGQRTSSFATVSSLPRPKWTRTSEAPP